MSIHYSIETEQTPTARAFPGAPDLGRIRRLLTLELSADERLLVLLRLREGESFESIAALLRMTTKRVKELFANVISRDLSADAVPPMPPRAIRVKEKAKPGGLSPISVQQRAEAAERHYIKRGRNLEEE